MKNTYVRHGSALAKLKSCFTSHRSQQKEVRVRVILDSFNVLQPAHIHTFFVQHNFSSVRIMPASIQAVPHISIKHSETAG